MFIILHPITHIFYSFIDPLNPLYTYISLTPTNITWTYHDASRDVGWWLDKSTSHCVPTLSREASVGSENWSLHFLAKNHLPIRAVALISGADWTTKSN